MKTKHPLLCLFLTGAILSFVISAGCGKKDTAKENIPDTSLPPAKEYQQQNSAVPSDTDNKQEQKIRILGDPQIKTDHPWFPGELSCSTFQRLFTTQKKIYERETGREIDSQEKKAIASWYWRNLNYFHWHSPGENYWDEPITDVKGNSNNVVRDYWTGLFAYGFSLCGTTHLQYTAEMEYLLGHCCSRVVGVSGHNSFEVFLKDPGYGPEGDWALLDHDISTIVFNDPENPTHLMSLWDITYSSQYPKKNKRSKQELENILDNTNAPEANRGWFISGLYFRGDDNSNASKSDAVGVYTNVRTAEYLAGYAGPPPMVSLRRGEALRRYISPGLGGTTYVYWGRSRMHGGIPGPNRGRTWAHQPEKMFRTTRDTGWTLKPDHTRFGNAVYTYRPDFKTGNYRDGVFSEGDDHVTFYFYSPYTIAACPAEQHAEKPWGVTLKGCTNGLVITAQEIDCTVQISTDNTASWSDPVPVNTKTDITDRAKGHHSYHIRFNTNAQALQGSNLCIRTVCILNNRLVPHLKPDSTTVTYSCSGQAVFAAGPNRDQASPYITGGGLKTDHVELTIPSPGGHPISAVYANGWVASGNPPDSDVLYNIDVSTDNGTSWSPIVTDWKILQNGYQPKDFWSQSMCFGSTDITEKDADEVTVRFSNTGKKQYRKIEAYLVYETPLNSAVTVRFNWNDKDEVKTAAHTFPADTVLPDSSWTIPTGSSVHTNWVEMSVE